jgi:hypothetical protein
MTTNCNHPESELIESETGTMHIAGGDLIEPETRLICGVCFEDVTDLVHERDLEAIGRIDREAEEELHRWMDEETRNPSVTDEDFDWSCVIATDGDFIFDCQ